MNLTRKLNQKINGTKMLLIGAGGRLLNEICGFIYDEPKTTSELNQLSNGYILKGFGHIFGEKSLINKGRTQISNYRSRSKSKQEIFAYINN